MGGCSPETAAATRWGNKVFNVREVEDDDTVTLVLEKQLQPAPGN